MTQPQTKNRQKWSKNCKECKIMKNTTEDSPIENDWLQRLTMLSIQLASCCCFRFAKQLTATQ